MALLKLKPACKDYIWGGHRLKDEYNKEYDGDVLAETWELSCHPDGPSVITNGAYAGKTLAEYIQEQGRSVLGKKCEKFKDFPILIKLIDAKDNLSIQVHPDNEYALKNEGQYGKTEMWYVVDCEEGAFLYYGFSREVSREEFEERIRNNTLTEVLNAVPVKKGDVFFIEAGTIHAIGKNILIAEIQQNSNVTYRVYDYGRKDKSGKTRELHIGRALDVTRRKPAALQKPCAPHLARCDYFTVDKICSGGAGCSGRAGAADPVGHRPPEKSDVWRGRATADSFVSILVLDGEGHVRCGGEAVSFRKGDSIFLSAGSGDYVIEGTCEALVTTAGKKENIRVGIDLGGTFVKISLVSEANELLAFRQIPTGAERPYREVIRDIAVTVRALFEESDHDLSECTGIGAGVPGTIDREHGVVLYSNNIRWKNVPFAAELGKYISVPVQIANDADCAALGEAKAGAGRKYKNLVMLTLGTGVGGGIVMDGRIFDGTLTGGSELGHMVICEDGEPCTCGRRGCLEAYASAAALVRDTKRAMEKDENSALWRLCGGEKDKVTAENVFDAAEGGDASARAVVDGYMKRLTTGIVNIVNIFRPEAVLLGGGVSNRGRTLTDRLNRDVGKYCFAGKAAEVPKVLTAELKNNAGMIGAANLF